MTDEATDDRMVLFHCSLLWVTSLRPLRRSRMHRLIKPSVYTDL